VDDEEEEDFHIDSEVGRDLIPFLAL